MRNPRTRDRPEWRRRLDCIAEQLLECDPGDPIFFQIDRLIEEVQKALVEAIRADGQLAWRSNSATYAREHEGLSAAWDWLKFPYGGGTT